MMPEHVSIRDIADQRARSSDINGPVASLLHLTRGGYCPRMGMGFQTRELSVKTSFFQCVLRIERSRGMRFSVIRKARLA